MIKRVLFSLVTCCTTLAASPKAVVFDFGGVLTGAPNREVVVQFLCRSFQLSHEEFEEVNLRKRQAIKNGMSDLEFWQVVARERELALPAEWQEEFRSCLKDSIGVNPAMYALVSKLKERGLVVGLLSNIDKRLANHIADFGFYEPFEPCLLSCEVGLEKPDPRIYELLLKRVNLKAADLVFVDDTPENVLAAKALGIDAIQFTTLAELQEALQERGIQLTLALSSTADQRESRQ